MLLSINTPESTREFVTFKTKARGRWNVCPFIFKIIIFVTLKIQVRSTGEILYIYKKKERFIIIIIDLFWNVVLGQLFSCGHLLYGWRPSTPHAHRLNSWYSVYTILSSSSNHISYFWILLQVYSLKITSNTIFK